ncbi:calcium-binding protein [Streptomyces sp. NPDC005046]
MTITYQVPDLAITTASLPAGTIGTPYSATIATSGGVGTPSFGVTSGALPPGLTLNPGTGQITGTPTATGSFPFTVTASETDPAQTAERAFTLTVSPATCATGTPTITGTNSANIIFGTPGDDVIFALGGNDVVDGRGGNDLICGGAGNDTLTGGDGNDALYGNADNDVLYGGSGTNTNDGGSGIDVCANPIIGPGCNP